MDIQFDSKLARTVSILKPIIEAHPDRFMWGKDLVHSYHYEQPVMGEAVKLPRAFLGRLALGVADKVPYKNAQTFLSMTGAR